VHELRWRKLTHPSSCGTKKNASESLRVVVTGGNGFLGRVLCSNLKHCELAVIDAYSSQDQTAKVQQFICDITDPNRISEFIHNYKPEAIVHLAAITGVKKCEENPREAFAVNVGGTANVADAAARSGSFLIFASSREVYGETVGQATAENDSLNPKNLYGVTKVMGEQVLWWFNRLKSLRFSILRFTNLYGPGGDQYVSNVIMKRALSNEDITIYGGSQTLNLIHVQDAARAITLALEKEVFSDAFNVGSADSVTLEELVGKIIKITNSHSRVLRADMRPNETGRFVPDLTKASRKLGFSSEISLEEGLLRLAKQSRTKD
jgi:UDP-glucose 4-epimerase